MADNRTRIDEARDARRIKPGALAQAVLFD
jgi:hypothetical protein